jgi:hypothetical protein
MGKQSGLWAGHGPYQRGLPTGGVLTGQPGTPAAANRITVHFSRRNPADAIPPTVRGHGRTLVASYAWWGGGQVETG